MPRPPTAELMVFDILSYSALAVLIWDFGLNLQREYRLIWKTTWNGSSIFYIWCRYYPLIVQIIYVSVFRAGSSGTLNVNTQVCQNMQIYRLVNSLLSLFTFQSILFYRNYILYGRDKKLLVLLVLTKTIAIGAQGAAAVTSMHHINYTHGCAGQTAVYAAIIFIIGTALALFITISLSIHKLVQVIKSGWEAQPPLTRTMALDNVLVPIYMSFAFIPGAVYGLRLGFQDIVVWEAGFVFLNMVLSLFVCRMITHVKEIEYKPVPRFAETTDANITTDFYSTYTVDTTASTFTVKNGGDGVCKN